MIWRVRCIENKNFPTVATTKSPRSYLGDASNGQTMVRMTQSFVNENGSRGWCRGSLADLKIVKMCAAIQPRFEFRHTYGLMTTSFPRSSGAAKVEDPWGHPISTTTWWWWRILRAGLRQATNSRNGSTGQREKLCQIVSWREEPPPLIL